MNKLIVLSIFAVSFTCLLGEDQKGAYTPNLVFADIGDQTSILLVTQLIEVDTMPARLDTGFADLYRYALIAEVFSESTDPNILNYTGVYKIEASASAILIKKIVFKNGYYSIIAGAADK